MLHLLFLGAFSFPRRCQFFFGGGEAQYHWSLLLALDIGFHDQKENDGGAQANSIFGHRTMLLCLVVRGPLPAFPRSLAPHCQIIYIPRPPIFGFAASLFPSPFLNGPLSSHFPPLSFTFVSPLSEGGAFRLRVLIPAVALASSSAHRQLWKKVGDEKTLNFVFAFLGEKMLQALPRFGFFFASVCSLFLLVVYSMLQDNLRPH